MADPFEIATPFQRRFLAVALTVYVALVIYELVVRTDIAAAVRDLALAVQLAPAGVVVIRRARAADPTDGLALSAGVGFLVSGVAIAYGGLATVDVVPAFEPVEVVGTVALIGAFVIFFIRRE